ncbi:hypothetical protein [Streptomyces sp. G45]|uniref:hypothetical protein n=1 Tax=Streptomyces sp. G45 TaxID=3406627 RepID=UPI003C1F3EEC
MSLTINVAFLLAVVIVLRIRRNVQARSRSNQMLTGLIVLVFGVLVAGTGFGREVADTVGDLAKALSEVAVP